MSSRSAVVIGGGITGSLTALQLRDNGWGVTLLEQGPMGNGSSSRTAGGIRQQFTTEGTVRAMRFAVASYLEFQQRVAAQNNEPNFRVIQQNGYLFCKPDSQWQAAKELVARQQRWGLHDVEALDLEELTRRFKYVRPSGDTPIAGATWCPSDGFLFPAPIYNGARTLLEASGGIVHQNTPVTEGIFSGARLVAVKTPKGDFAADIFIDATNAWTNRLAKLLGGIPFPLKVAPLKRHVWYSPRQGSMPSGVLAAMPLVIGPSGAYGRPENENQLLFSKLPPRTTPQPDFTDDDQNNASSDFDHRSSEAYLDAMMELAGVIPDLADFGRPVATAPGFYGSTPDHNPFFGFDPQTPNLMRLVGFSGHGAMMGPFSALVALQLAEAGKNIAEVLLPQGVRVSLAPFMIGRLFESHEGLVI